MNRLSLLYSFLIIVALSSCSSIKKLKDKDNATTGVSRNKSKVKPTFIDGIEVTPGSVIKSKQKPLTTKEFSNNDSSKINNNTTTFNAFSLQQVYAERLKVDVNFINNENLYSKIDEWWATKYCLGGSSKNCIDCSAFTLMIAKEVYKIDLLRTAQQQYNNALKISKDELVEGDLVFFQTKRNEQVTHVGVYLINNKFVHASTSSGVMISDLNDTYWQAKFYAAGRIVKR